MSSGFVFTGTVSEKSENEIEGVIETDAGEKLPYQDEDLPGKDIEEGDTVRFDRERPDEGREYATNLSLQESETVERAG